MQKRELALAVSLLWCLALQAPMRAGAATPGTATSAPGVAAPAASAPAASAPVAATPPSAASAAVTPPSAASAAVVPPEPPLAESIGRIAVEAQRDLWLESSPTSAVAVNDVGEALSANGQTSSVRKGSVANDVVLRGFQRDNLAVTVNGARLYGACPNRMDPPAFHLDIGEVERIEVQRGPFGVQTPGALGGAVHLRTRAAPLGLRSTLDAGYGSFADLRSAATLSYGAEQYDLLVGGSFRTAQPFAAGGRPFTELASAESPNRYATPEPGTPAYALGGGWAKAGYSPKDGHRLEVSYARSMARDVLYPYLLMDAVADDTDRVGVTYALDRRGALHDGSL